MIITKIFKGESSHAVRCAFSTRCSRSIHGHSFVLEVRLEGDKLDRAGMLYDFGLMKGTIGQFVDASDHCHLIWSDDREEYKEFIKNENERWIELPFNPTAEQLSMFFFAGIDYILQHTETSNGEGQLRVHSVTYHETTTGSATCHREDVETLFGQDWLQKTKFSQGIIDDWSEELKLIVFEGKTIKNSLNS